LCEAPRTKMQRLRVIGPEPLPFGVSV
jgi:hypothetical protein